MGKASTAKLTAKLVLDSGTSSTDLITQTGSVSIAGAARGDVLSFRWSADGGLTWSTWQTTTGTIAAPTSDGSWIVQIQERTSKGALVTSTSLAFTLDTQAAAPGVALVEDTGASHTDGVSSLGTLQLSGLEKGAAVQYSIDGGQTWGTSFAAREGGNDVLIRQVDLAGNVSTAAKLGFVLDTQAAAPGASLAHDSGTSPSDGLTQDSALAVTGLEAGAAVQFSVDGGQTWSTGFAAQEGVNDLLVRQVDAAGNVSASSALRFELDTTAPVAPAMSLATAAGGEVTFDLSPALPADAALVGMDLQTGQGGQVVSNPDGTWTYLAPAGFTGTDGLSYQVADAAGNVGTGQILFDVMPQPGAAPFVPHDPAAVAPADLVAALVGAPSASGIAVIEGSVQLVESGPGAVNVYDGSLAPLGIGAGLLLTSGTTPGVTNTSDGFGADNGGPLDPVTWEYLAYNGDADLNAVVNTVFSTTSYDATSLTFSFTVSDPAATSVSFNLVFGSDEFPEWVDAFVDCGIVLVNGQNVALFNHDAMAPLSVIGSNLAAGYFGDNTDGHLPIEYDGVSRVLTIVSPIQEGVNTVKIGIGDTGDHILDSGIFVSDLHASNWQGSGVLVEDTTTTGGSDSVTGGGTSDLVDAGAGNDTVSSGGGDDLIDAGDGDDVVAGGSGSDTLTGGAGADEFDFSDPADWAAFDQGHCDTITDFAGNSVALSDAIDLDAIDGDVILVSQADLVVLAGAGWNAAAAPSPGHFTTIDPSTLSIHTDGNASSEQGQFVYDAASGMLGFDPDGTRDLAALDIVLVGNHPAQIAAEYIALLG